MSEMKMDLFVEPVDRRVELAPMFFGDLFEWIEEKIIKPVSRWITRSGMSRYVNWVLKIGSKFLVFRW